MVASARGASPEWGTASSSRPGCLSAGKTVLGWATCGPVAGKTFSKVVLMGPYWSGTNAVREEVLWRFHAPVLNPDKLEVHAPTAEAVAALCEALAEGPALARATKVGKQSLPEGYRLLDGPQVRLPPQRSYRFQPWARQHDPPTAPAPGGGESAQPSKPPEPPAEAAAEAGVGAGLLRSTEPPVTVTFGPQTNGDCPWWKHAVRLKEQGPIDTDEDTLVILVTKDPFFWLKSVSKHFYEMKVWDAPRRCRAGLDHLFSELEHEGRSYADALELWSSAMGAFLDEELYPSDRCVLLRYEDFLFNFWDVMLHIAAFLPANCQRLKEAPTSKRSKNHGKDVRGREEALRFYALEASRHCDFSPKHFERLRTLSPELLLALGYVGVRDGCVDGVPPPRGLNPWVPPLRVGDIVAVRFRGLEVVQTNGDAPEPEDAGDDTLGAPWRTWARVALVTDDGESAVVEILSEVPRDWLVPVPHDWSVVAWPVERWPGDMRLRPQECTVAREWLDLRLPMPPGRTGKALPLTEEGYRDAVSLRSTPQMAEFISRVIGELEVNGARVGRVLEWNKLLGFARWFSGEANVQSLAQIRRELPGKEAERWVTFAPPRPTRRLLEPDAAAPARPTREVPATT